jgi:hypothetical protein
VPRLTALDELLVHQIPEPLTSPALFHEHWRESLFFIIHPRDAIGDCIILTMAHFPAREELDVLQLGHFRGVPTLARHHRASGDNPHELTVGPVQIDVVEPFKTLRLRVAEDAAVPLAMDITFEARTPHYALRRGGPMKAGHEVIWDQSHMVQSGTYNGTVTLGGETFPIENWWGQRDHSWGIRNHARCPFWMWLAVQLPDGMLAVWNWEYANGARVFTDGCFAPADGSPPIAAVAFRHDLHWTNKDGDPVSYERDGDDVAGVAGRVEFDLEDGTSVGLEASGVWAQRYGPVGGGLNQVEVTADDGRTGTAIYELTGAHHHRYFPVARAENLPK